MDGMTAIERLVAIEDIKVLKFRRDKALDDQDWETYRELHAPDHWSLHQGGDWKSADEMIEKLAPIMAGTVSAHHSHSPVITFETPTRANCTWAMEDNLFWKQGEEDHWSFGFGYYLETCEKRDGRWVFTSRRLLRIINPESEGAYRGPNRTTEWVNHVKRG